MNMVHKSTQTTGVDSAVNVGGKIPQTSALYGYSVIFGAVVEDLKHNPFCPLSNVDFWLSVFFSKTYSYSGHFDSS